jgi:hypothetical protein
MRLLRLLLLAFVLTPPLRAQQPTPILPDPKLTPGDVFDVTATDVCAPGYSRKVRNVPQSVKEEVYSTTPLDLALAQQGLCALLAA